MAITFIDGATQSYETDVATGPVTSFVIPVPTAGGALQTGDFLIVGVTWDTPDTTLQDRTLPSGWTSLVGGVIVSGTTTTTAVQHDVIYHVVTAGEAGTSPTWTITNNPARDGALAVARFRGVDTADPFAVSSPASSYSLNKYNTSVNPKISPAVTTDAAATVLVAGSFTRSGSQTLTSFTAGYTMAANGYAIGGRAAAVVYKDQAVAGASTTCSWTTSSSAAGGAWQTALNPFTGAPADTTDPSVPANVVAVADSPTQVTISWDASTDDVGVSSYRVRRGGSDLFGATAVVGTTFVDTTVAPNTAYSYTASAVDASGNRSGESTAAPVTTPPDAVAVDSVAGAAVSAANNLISWTHTVGSGATLLIAQVSYNDGGRTVTAATFAGSAMTFLNKRSSGTAGTDRHLEFWYVVNPPAGAGTVSFTMSGTAPLPVGESVSYFNTATTSIFGTFVSDSSTSAAAVVPRTITAASATGEKIHTGISGRGAAPVAPSGATNTRTDLAGPAAPFVTGGVGVMSGASSVDVTWTSDANSWAVAAVPIHVTAPPPPTQPTTLVHTWTGVPDGEGAPVIVHTTGVTSVRLKVGTNAAVTAGVVFTPAEAPDSAGYATFNVSGLSPGTDYWYQVELDGALDTVNTGMFTTDIPGAARSFRVAFGSCLESDDSTRTAFDNILANDPELFLHLGDFMYGNSVSTDPAVFRGLYESQIAVNGGLRDLLRKVPTGYITSDHDSGPNDWTGGPGTQTPAWNTAYRQLVPVQATLPTGGTYYSVHRGRVKFILTDGRSFKSPKANTDDASKTMFGFTQEAWIASELADTNYPVKVLVVDVPWVYATTAGDDKWGGYTAAANRLVADIASAGARVFLIHGDSHTLVADDGTSANNRGDLPVAGAAPFGKPASIKGGPYSQGTYPASGTALVHQHGLLDITDTGTAITIRYSGRDDTNTERITLTKTFSFVSTGALTAAADATVAIGGSQAQVNTLAASANTSVGFGGTHDVQGVLNPAASASLALSGTQSRFGGLTISSSAAVTLTAQLVRTGSITPSAAAALSLGARQGFVRSLPMSASAVLSLSARQGFVRSLSIAAAAAMSLSAQPGSVGALSASAAASLNLTGMRTQPGALALPGVASATFVRAAGTTAGVLPIAATANITVIGIHEFRRALSMGASASAVVAGRRTVVMGFSTTTNAAMSLLVLVARQLHGFVQIHVNAGVDPNALPAVDSTTDIEANIIAVLGTIRALKGIASVGIDATATIMYGNAYVPVDFDVTGDLHAVRSLAGVIAVDVGTFAPLHAVRLLSTIIPTAPFEASVRAPEPEEPEVPVYSRPFMVMR